jgi:hypothetical protein
MTGAQVGYNVIEIIEALLDGSAPLLLALDVVLSPLSLGEVLALSLGCAILGLGRCGLAASCCTSRANV